MAINADQGYAHSDRSMYKKKLLTNLKYWNTHSYLIRPKSKTSNQTAHFNHLKMNKLRIEMKYLKLASQKAASSSLYINNMGETDVISAQSEDSDLEYPRPRRNVRCGDFCSFNIFKIPGLLLRNVVFPREMWDEFPNGLEHIADYFVYQPDHGNAREIIPTPELIGLKCKYEEVTIHTKDSVKLHAYLIKQFSTTDSTTSIKGVKLDTNANEHPKFPATQPVPLIIYFHGNAGNIGSCLEVVKTCRINPVLAACNWLLVEYRGYGKSEGKQSEKGLYSDAKAALRYAESRFDLKSSKIVLMGHSMGGAVAIHLASHPRFRNRVSALILENTFTSIPSLAKKIMELPIINYVPNFCYSSKFESIDKIGKVKCPTLFLCGTEDEIVPVSMTEELYDKCASTVKILAKLEDGQHNDTFKCFDYLPKLANFIKNQVMYPNSNNIQAQSKWTAAGLYKHEFGNIPIRDYKSSVNN